MPQRAAENFASRFQLVARCGQAIEPLPKRPVHRDHDQRHDGGHRHQLIQENGELD
jgi:hypothetical protein